MAFTLEDMTEEEFEAFRGMSVQNFAKQNITSGTWTEKRHLRNRSRHMRT